MLRDRDGVYGEVLRGRLQVRSIEDVLAAPQSPWQTPYAERLVGSVRREGLDHAIVLGEQHLCRSRTHLSLGKDAPDAREVYPPSMGEIVELPEVGGLHHRYERLAG
jgi:putative transposase